MLDWRLSETQRDLKLTNKTTSLGYEWIDNKQNVQELFIDFWVYF